MVIELTNVEVLQAEAALQELAKERMAFSAAMKVRRMARVLKGMVEDIHEEQRKIAEPYLKRDDKGRIVRETEADGREIMPFASPADREAYIAAANELLACKVTYDGEPLKAGEMGLNEVKPELLVALGPLLEEGE